MLKPNFEKKELYLKYKETAPDIPKIEVDEKLLLNVFMNLIDNAEKYTNEGGLTITISQEGDNVKIEFIDTGIGINKEDKKILFKKFSRGSKSNYINPNGSGLGLFIIKQIIHKHHGKIKVASKGENMGTTFTVLLPIKQKK
jgi:signal transduction histidine kinase